MLLAFACQKAPNRLAKMSVRDTPKVGTEPRLAQYRVSIEYVHELDRIASGYGVGSQSAFPFWPRVNDSLNRGTRLFLPPLLKGCGAPFPWKAPHPSFE
jgi:hypothetical protein